MATVENQTVQDVQKMFAFYGFTACPLSRWQIGDLEREGFNLDTIYRFGCDYVAGDWDHAELVEYYKQEESTA